MCEGVVKPRRLRYVPVMFARPALGRSSLNTTSSGRPEPPIATGTGACSMQQPYFRETHVLLAGCNPSCKAGDCSAPVMRCSMALLFPL